MLITVVVQLVGMWQLLGIAVLALILACAVALDPTFASNPHHDDRTHPATERGTWRVTDHDGRG